MQILCLEVLHGAHTKIMKAPPTIYAPFVPSAEWALFTYSVFNISVRACLSGGCTLLYLMLSSNAVSMFYSNEFNDI